MHVNDQTLDLVPVRNVKPRTRGYADLSIIAIDYKEQTVWTETKQYRQPLEQLPRIVLEEPDSILVGYEVGLCVKQIAEDFQHLPTFQIQCSPIERELAPWKKTTVQRNDDGTTQLHTVETGQRTVVHGVSFAFIGWRDKRKRWATRHYPVDPMLFTSSFKSEYHAADRSLGAVIRWAMQVRDFLQANDLTFRATQSGIAAQLLRDSRFYPDARRKVPQATNGRARENLPGNYYLHRADRKQIYSAVEIDQRSSHHACARDIEFPHPDYLHAKGYFKDLPDKPYALAGTVLFDRLIAERGLFYVKLRVPTNGGGVSDTFVLPAADYAGTDVDGRRLAYVYSNELSDLQSSGVVIEYIVAAWTSRREDTGLNRFAEWAILELAKCDAERKRWLKPLLLSAYGLLATKPRPIRAGYLQGKDGKRMHYHVGRGEVMQFIKHESKHPFEPGFVNVVHRGMIEAETRLRSLQMARYLKSIGFEILVVYADAVFVTGERQLPLLPDDWGITHITGAHFPNTNQVVCDQYAKLPGHAGKRREVLIHEIQAAVS